MTMKSSLSAACVVVALLGSLAAHAVDRPSLIMTKAGVEKIRAELGSVPLFDTTLARVKAVVDGEIEFGIDTPIPKDFSGGYTHARHKRNFQVMQQAGLLFQILEDERYAKYVRDMLFQYEAMYKDLPVHPQTRSYARGKLFWQCLNDSNWLVYTAQAYDLIYDYLSAEERAALEDNLFRPFADFISVGNPQFYNRIHNHSTWGNAAVGMIGLAMNDDELVQRALYGLEDDGLDTTARDNDGGFIKVAGQDAGFLANLREPFSPDGYYTEGPYYQRYAMYPFLVFAQALNNVRPELEIFDYKDGVLLKAVHALLNLTDADGEFFTLNDAQRGMSHRARSLVTAVDVAYYFGGRDPALLSVAEEQGEVLLDDTGIAVALAVRAGKARPFEKASVNYTDGPDGQQGGLAVLRQGDDALTLVFKYTAQGLSHGHYDKLSYSLFEGGDEVLQDYGMVRFVNIEQKGGGNYLPENSTWAKQTVAHNTLVQNQTSHFQGKYEIASQHHSELHFFDASRDDIHIVSAIESNAYPATIMQRTMALVRQDGFEKPFLVDVLKVRSEEAYQYDLPFNYLGQALEANFDYDAATALTPLGKDHGYQHLYMEAMGKAAAANTRFQWMNAGKFYSLTLVTEPSDELLFTRLGASDPEFNLRRDPAFMLRRISAKNPVFISVVEPHGHYNPVTESGTNARSNIAALDVLHDDDNYTAVSIEDLQGRTQILIVSNTDAATATRHRFDVGGQTYRWTGPFHYVGM